MNEIELIELLRAQAKEIAAAGHNGWGNTMLEAAAALAASRQRDSGLVQFREAVEFWRDDAHTRMVYLNGELHERVNEADRLLALRQLAEGGLRMSIERQARELLAEAYKDRGMHGVSMHIRSTRRTENSVDELAALDAITAALATQQPQGSVRQPVDDPELDGTDGAHPAYWRGTDAGVAGAVSRIEAVLDGKDDGKGVLGGERLEALRRRLLAAAPSPEAQS